jgi:Flp pilus assembly protein TadB
MILSKYFIINANIFIVGIICLILAPFSIVLNFLALFLLGVGFLMLAYSFTKKYNKLKKQIDTRKQEEVLEMAMQDDGEDYVYTKNKVLDKQSKQIKRFFRDKLYTIITLYVLGFTLLYFSVRLLMF